LPFARRVLHGIVPLGVRRRYGSAIDVNLAIDDVRLAVPLKLAEAYRHGREPGTVDYLRRVLRSGMTAVDVGAQIGHLSLVMGQAVGAHGRVLAIEPAPTNLQYIRKNLERNQALNISVVAAAAGPSTGRRQLNINADSSCCSFYDHPLGGNRTSLEVDQISLDELLPDGADLVKLDVEGAELEVIEGAPRLFASCPRLVVEWNPACMSAAGHRPSTLLAVLSSIGYTLHMIEDGTPSEAPLEQLADLAEHGELPVDWYTNLACERDPVAL
jgi:FkbM family methyltransferase